MRMTIRPATPADAAGIIAILNPIIHTGLYTALDTPFTEEQEREFITTFPARGIFNVATNDEDAIAGFQNVEPFASYTRAFDHVGVIGTYVDLNRRRQGIAAQLFAQTEKAALAKGYEKLFAFVRADNPAALATYKRQGFEVIGTARRHARIQGRYIDEQMIEKLLSIPRLTLVSPAG